MTAPVSTTALTLVRRISDSLPYPRFEGHTTVDRILQLGVDDDFAHCSPHACARREPSYQHIMPLHETRRNPSGSEYPAASRLPHPAASRRKPIAARRFRYRGT